MHQSPIHVPQEKIEAFCRTHSVARLSLFGSVLREDFGPESDIDILIEFPPGQTPSLLDLGGMLLELQEMFGREVDLKTPGFLSQYIHQRVQQEARTLYAA